MFAVALVLLAAQPAPRIVSNAEVYVFAPRLDRLESLRAFTTAAGKKTAMMRSVVWGDELLPMLSVDILSPESLNAAGIDPQGSLTTSFPPEGVVACVNVANAEAFVTRVRRAGPVAGQKWTGTIPNAQFGAVMNSSGGVVSGFVQRGTVGCVIRSNKGRGGNLMFEAEKLLGTPKVPAGFKNLSAVNGPLLFGSPNAVASVKGTDNSLIVDARGVKLPISTPALAPPGMSPFATIPQSGVLTLKARVDPAAIAPYARNFALQLLSYCSGCTDKALSDAVLTLTSELTGNLFLRVDSVVINPPAMRTDQGRYFAVRHAYFAEMKNAAAVKSLFKKLPAIKGLLRTENGVQLTAEEGTVDVRVMGNFLVMSNDEAALQNAQRLVMAATPAKMTHSLEADGDPRPVGKALRKVSILDALANAQMAGFFAAGVELGPLLAVSERATLWVDSGSPMKAQAVWTLEPPKAGAQPTGDAGSDATPP